jgi:hypothetical protein
LLIKENNETTGENFGFFMLFSLFSCVGKNNLSKTLTQIKKADIIG